MRTEHGSLEGDLAVTEDLTLYGVATGSVIVSAARSLHLYGMCRASLIVQPGASASVFGVVAGDLVNSGLVQLKGIVPGLRAPALQVSLSVSARHAAAVR